MKFPLKLRFVHWGLLAVFLFVQWPPAAKAVSREIITSATYGVLAGTIVGSATLAFTENPGDNLSRIARGASLGLYAGLILGFYVTYGVSSEAEYYEEGVQVWREPPKFALIPLSDERGHIEGASAQWNFHRF